MVVVKWYLSLMICENVCAIMQINKVKLKFYVHNFCMFYKKEGKKTNANSHTHANISRNHTVQILVVSLASSLKLFFFSCFLVFSFSLPQTSRRHESIRLRAWIDWNSKHSEADVMHWNLHLNLMKFSSSELMDSQVYYFIRSEWFVSDQWILVEHLR